MAVAYEFFLRCECFRDDFHHEMKINVVREFRVI